MHVVVVCHMQKLGITGTLKTLSNIMSNKYQLSRNTYMPSLFGDRRDRFTFGKLNHIGLMSDKTFCKNLKETINMNDNTSQRCVFVVFSNKRSLNNFYQSEQYSSGLFKRNTLIMTQDIDKDVKHTIIKRAATTPPRPTPALTPCPPMPVIFDLFWIIFKIIFYVFVDLNNEFINEIILNENESEFLLGFENVNCDFDFYNYGDLCNGPRCPKQTPRPNPFDFINSRAELREQLALIGVFDIVYGEYVFDNDLYNVIICCPYFYPCTIACVCLFNNIGLLDGPGAGQEQVGAAVATVQVGSIGLGFEVAVTVAAVVSKIMFVCLLLLEYMFAPLCGVVLQTIIGLFATEFAVLISSFNGVIGDIIDCCVRYKFAAKLAAHLRIGIYFIMVYGFIGAICGALLSSIGLQSSFDGYGFAPATGTVHDNLVMDVVSNVQEMRGYSDEDSNSAASNGEKITYVASTTGRLVLVDSIPGITPPF